jgi:hypothetical protein
VILPAGRPEPDGEQAGRAGTGLAGRVAGPGRAGHLARRGRAGWATRRGAAWCSWQQGQVVQAIGQGGAGYGGVEEHSYCRHVPEGAVSVQSKESRVVGDFAENF